LLRHEKDERISTLCAAAGAYSRPWRPIWLCGFAPPSSSFPIRPAPGTIWMGVPLLLTPPRGKAPRLVSHARNGATPRTGLRCSLFEVCFITPLEG
jgi:hypothetical protein